MKKVWCWRCNRWVHGLSNDDHDVIYALYRECTIEIKQREYPAESKQQMIQQGYTRLFKAFEALTGDSGIAPEEIIKHKASKFGPPCIRCSKNLRTPIANKCFECGQVK